MTVRRDVRWERMFPDELEAEFTRCPLVWYAYGMCEPHGPHNAVGLDTLKAHAIVCQAARAHGGIVAPPDYWHIHELGGYAGWAHDAVGAVDRPWLTSVPPWVHFRNICYHIRTADTMGFHAAIFVTGHYGPNWEDFKTLVDLLQPYVGTRLYCLPDFEANEPGFDNDGLATGDHAGKVETSLLWAVEPDCVDMSRLPADDDNRPHFAMGANAGDADRRVGERMVADEVRWLGAKAKELLADYAATQPEHRLRTFADVERVWHEVVRPAIPDFRTMQAGFGWDTDVVPEDSVWFPNQHVPAWN